MRFFLNYFFLTHAALSVLLLTIGAARKKRAFFIALALLLWLTAIVSFFFVGWGWLDRGLSRNWPMFGVWFISLPVISLNALLAGSGLLAIRFRGVEERSGIRRSFLSVLLFLVFQVALILWSA